MCNLNFSEAARTVEEADWVTFEPLLFRLVAFDLGQSANPMPLKAAVQGRARQVRDGRLKRIKAVIKRQERVPAEGDDDRLLLDGQHRRSRLLRPGPEVRDAVARLPIANGILVDPVALRESSQARLTMLYRSTDRLCRAGQRPLFLTDVSPVAVADGGDGAGLGEEVAPGLAGRLDDGVISLEHAVGEPVLAQVSPDVLDRVQLRGARGQEEERDVLRHGEPAARVPAGAVEEEHGVGAAPDHARDLLEVELHGLAVGIGHGEGRAGCARRADGAEQVGALVALVGGLARARAAPRPLAHEAVLLADAGLVLEPDLDGLTTATCERKFSSSLGVRSSCPSSFRACLLSLSASWTRSFVCLCFFRTGKRCCSSRLATSSGSVLS